MRGGNWASEGGTETAPGTPPPEIEPSPEASPEIDSGETSPVSAQGAIEKIRVLVKLASVQGKGIAEPSRKVVLMNL